MLRSSDEAVLALVAAGDDQALGVLYDRFGRFAYGLSLRIVRDPGLAEEAVQEAFLSVWRSAGRFDDRRGTVRGWLLTIVHRRAVDLVQLAVRGQELTSERAVERPSPSTEEFAAVREEQRVVRRALELIPDAQRQALELAYYGGYSQSQIAARLDVPLGTVKSRIFHGLLRLRTLLEDPGPLPAQTGIGQRRAPSDVGMRATLPGDVHA